MAEYFSVALSNPISGLKTDQIRRENIPEKKEKEN